METVRVKIDGQEIEVSKDTTIIEAAKRLNILIPTFCYHEKLPIFGGCRMCLVYDAKMKRSVIACGTYVYDGMEIETENPQVKKDREFILQMLFSRHPLDCPICDKAGECDLQNWGTYWGPQKNLLSIDPTEKVRPEEDWESSYLEYVSNRCVLCMKCVSVCDNINKSHSIYPLERAFETLISSSTKPMDTSSCEMCGLCVDICPVGAILFKPFKFNARPWLLKETYTHCGFCSLNCPVVVNHDGQNVYRIRSTAELEVCSKVYLGYDSLNHNRLKVIKYGEKPLDVKELLIKLLNSEKTAVFVSSYLSSETLQTLEKIWRKSKAHFTSDISLSVLPLLDGYGEDYHMLDFDVLKQSSKVYVVGDDIVDTSPVLSYYLPEGLTYVGDSLDRLKKLNPEVVELSGEDILSYLRGIEENSTVVYSSYFYGELAYRFGKLLRELQESKGCKVFIIPPTANAFGVVNKIESLGYLPEVIKKIERGEIENLIMFGEEMVEWIEDYKFKDMWDKLKRKVLFTPFEDGLSLIADVSIPLNSWIEESGSFEGSRGIRKIKQALKVNFSTRQLLEDVCRSLTETERKTQLKVKGYTLPDFITINQKKIYDVSYFSLRSKNLTNWKEKLAGETVDEH